MVKRVRRIGSEASQDAPRVRPNSEFRIREDRTLPEQTPTRESEAGVDRFVSQVGEIRRLYAKGEVEAALDLATLVQPRGSAFSLHAVPVVVCTPAELLALPLDARSGFLLARIDGFSTLQTLLDVSAMPEPEAMSLLEELLSLGAVRLLPPANTDSTTPIRGVTSRRS
jgi:hypothetical protein